ncbi:hypothetical protein GCM10010483_66570 [Actinokineospora diospyrosa]
MNACAHSGYAGKSAITAMIRSGGASTTMDWVDSSAMPGRLPGAHPRAGTAHRTHQRSTFTSAAHIY